MLHKIMRKTLAVIIAITTVVSAFSVSASAVADTSINEVVDAIMVSNEDTYLEGLISVEDFQAMKQESNSDLARSVNSTVFVSGYNSYVPYAQSEFTQTNGCGPTAAANILSFYQGARGVSLFNGDYITQSIYNQICSDVGWTTSGTNMVNLSNGLQTFCSRAGKTCSIDTYLLNLWSDVTRDVNAGLPILVNDVTQSHFMVIFGYDTIGNNKYIYVCTGLTGNGQSLFGYFPW